MNRRTFLSLAPAAAAYEQKTDRRGLVALHAVRLHAIDPDSPLSGGNGEFAFTADVTGVWSIPDAYESTVPLCTQAQWGWHRSRIPDGLSSWGLRLEMFDSHGWQVGYATVATGEEKLFNWLREHPHV